MRTADLKRAIRKIPDFPKPGVTFYDVATLFRNGEAFRTSVDRMVERYRGERIDAIAAIEARGFVLGSVLAHQLEVGFIMVRKVGKLPGDTEGESYDLEYGKAQIEVQRDAVAKGQRILVVDDLLATAGTAIAARKLLERLGGVVDGFGFLVELGFLEGRSRIKSENVFSLIRYD